MASLSVLCSTLKLRANYLAHTMEYPRLRMMRLTLPLLIVMLSTFFPVVMCGTSRHTVSSRLHIERLTAVTDTWARQMTEICFSCFASRHSYRPETNGVSFVRSTFTNIAKTSIDTAYWFFVDDKEFYHSTLLVTHTHHWPTPLWGAAGVVLSVRNVDNFVTRTPGTTNLFHTKSHVSSSITGQEKNIVHYFLGSLRCVKY
jgi:hypothetical protein